MAYPRKTERNQAVVELVRNGLRMQDVADRVGISRQRVQQIVREAGLVLRPRVRKMDMTGGGALSSQDIQTTAPTVTTGTGNVIPVFTVDSPLEDE